jgi:hypothetical protein
MLACNTFGWYRALRVLADSPELRTTLAARFLDDFHSKYAIEKLNRGLVSFLQQLQGGQERVPISDLEMPLDREPINRVDHQCNMTTRMKRGLKRLLYGASERIKA